MHSKLKFILYSLIIIVMFTITSSEVHCLHDKDEEQYTNNNYVKNFKLFFRTKPYHS
ncbi:hypothetical protein [Wolbachia endosymbiont of Pentidionis agamae]|uniref:hypothetical protein n=1 Tax=Wolbachia endosymbiont of Pentidionis agamae TaxID=3110435 RepID=UPI002FD5F682